MSDIKKTVVRFEPFTDVNGYTYRWGDDWLFADSSVNCGVYCDTTKQLWLFNTVVTAQLFCDLLMAQAKYEGLSNG